jgi:hypothetical protein
MCVANVVVVNLRSKKVHTEYICSRKTRFVLMGETALGTTEFRSPGVAVSFSLENTSSKFR